MFDFINKFFNEILPIFLEILINKFYEFLIN